MSSQNENNTQKGRCTLNDDTHGGVLSITMEKLMVQDTGEYWCALHDDSRLFPIKEIKLAGFIGAERDHGQARAAKGLCHQDGLSSALSRFPKRVQKMMKEFRSKQDVRHFLQWRHWDAGGLTAQTLWKGTRWAAPTNAPRPDLRTAMELRALLLLPLCFPALQAQTPDDEERQPEGSTLHIRCPYAARTDSNHRKGWSRLVDEKWEFLLQTTSGIRYQNITKATKGNVAILDDHQRRTVSITMTNLQAEDSGTYSCFSYSYRSGYIFLRTISLTVFKELHRWELDSLSVQCPYSALWYSTGKKAWCRSDGRRGCKVVASTDYPSTRRNPKALEERTLIQDDTSTNTATVTMQKLQAQDSGMYWCEVYEGAEIVQKTHFNLSVSKRTQQYTVEESGNVSVRCPYSAPHYGALNKAWCKEGASKPCSVLVSTKTKPSGDLRAPQPGRVRIEDDTQQGIVTITMEKLQIPDSGVYWCALYEDSHLFRMAEVTLSISEGEAPNISSTSPIVPFNSTEEEERNQHRSNTQKFIVLSGVLSFLFILALISSVTLCVRRHKQLKRRGNREAEDTYDKPEDVAQLDSTEGMDIPKDSSKDLKYVTLNFKSRLSPEDPLYCNVEPSQAHRKPKDENVEYATIALNQLPTNDKG